MHNHNCGCKHELEYCGHCDVVYCKKCSKEWKSYKYDYYKGWNFQSVTSPTVTYKGSVDTINCSHHQ